jgi:hypothetical protein
VPDARTAEGPAGEGPAIDLADFGAVAPLSGIPPALLTTSVTVLAEPRPVLVPPPAAARTPSWASAPPITGSIAQPPLEAIVEPPPMPRPAIKAAAPTIEPVPPVQSRPPPAPPRKLATVKRANPPAFKNDPRFPNVVVLPPPSSGSGSSFVVLGTH